jgi:hypothetical protein
MGGSGAKHQSLFAIKTNSELLVRHKMRKVQREGRTGVSDQLPVKRAKKGEGIVFVDCTIPFVLQGIVPWHRSR